MTRRILLCLAPAAVACACALAWSLAGSRLGVWAFVPLPTVLASVGVLVSGAALAGVLVPSAPRRARLAGGAEADARRCL